MQVPVWLRKCWPYVLAVGAVAAAFAVRWRLDPVLGHYAPFVVFLLAVTVTAWFGGLIPGLLATLLSAATGNYFFTEPALLLHVAHGVELVSLLIFVAEAVLITGLSTARLAARRRAEAHIGRLRRLTSELTLAEQRERRRLAAVLHDHLQQLLVAARMQAHALIRRLSGDDRATAEGIADLLTESLAATRDLNAELSPAVLYHGTLAESLRWLAERYRSRFGLHVQVRVNGDNSERVRLPEDARVLLFEAVRELLFNVVKHAGVDSAEVTLSRVEQGVSVLVADTGNGYEPRSSGLGLGLATVRERLDNLGGCVRTTAALGRGTRVELQLPCDVPGPA